MLLNYLKTTLPEGWRNQFKHHESYPEEYYDVAEIELDSGEKKVLVLNRNTDDLMEYYYDDIPDDQWISLKKVLKSERSVDCSNYFINRKYEIFNNKVNRLKLLTVKNHRSTNLYPKTYFNNDNMKVSIYNHRIIALVFIPNLFPKVNNIVNHINHDIKDFSLKNLEWCNLSYNSKHKNQNRQSHFINIKYLRISKDGEILNEWSNVSEFKKEYPEYRRALNKDKLYKGCYWVSKNLILEDYKSRHPVVEDGWYVNPFITERKVEANLCGILRIDGKETVGQLFKYSFYYKVQFRVNGKQKEFFTHRLVYETISGKKIDSENVIDHIQPVRSIETINNEYSNLREVTQKENMNNPETRKFRGNPCSCFDLTGKLIKTFPASTLAAEFFSSSSSLINKCCRNISRISNELLWCFLGEEEKIIEDISYNYYKFNNGELIKSSISLRNLTNSKNTNDVNKYKKYLNTGMPAPDGYYYQQGDPKNMLYDPDNTSYVKKREELKWKPTTYIK